MPKYTANYTVPSLTGDRVHEVTFMSNSLEDVWLTAFLDPTDPLKDTHDLNLFEKPDGTIGASAYPLVFGKDGILKEVDTSRSVEVALQSINLADDDPLPTATSSGCPKCGAGDDEVSWDGDREFGDSSAHQVGRCNSCGCSWAAVYKFSHNEILN